MTKLTKGQHWTLGLRENLTREDLDLLVKHPDRFKRSGQWGQFIKIKGLKGSLYSSNQEPSGYFGVEYPDGEFDYFKYNTVEEAVVAANKPEFRIVWHGIKYSTTCYVIIAATKGFAPKSSDYYDKNFFWTMSREEAVELYNDGLAAYFKYAYTTPVHCHGNEGAYASLTSAKYSSKDAPDRALEKIKNAGISTKNIWEKSHRCNMSEYVQKSLSEKGLLS